MIPSFPSIARRFLNSIKPSPRHDSDCALHNGPAYEPGPCDCSASDAQRDDRKPNYGRSPADTSEIDALRQEAKRNTLRHPWRKPQA